MLKDHLDQDSIFMSEKSLSRYVCVIPLCLQKTVGEPVEDANIRGCSSPSYNVRFAYSTVHPLAHIRSSLKN